MNLTWAKPHIFYVVLIAGATVGVHSWLQEHDARLLSDQQVKVSQAQVAAAQKQIEAVNAAATQQVKVITQVVHDSQTPAKFMQNLPQLAPTQLIADLGARIAPQLQPTELAVQSQGLAYTLGTLKECQVNLGACQQTSTLKDDQLASADEEIKALKKKPAFWHRVGSTLKVLGIGVGIGLAVSGRL
jgi:hypothetical protein